MSSLPRSTPPDQGLSAVALERFVAALDASDQEMHTVMVLRHGHVVLEREWAPYRLADRHLLFSVSKSFTSMAIGLVVDAGLLSLDDQVISFFSGDDLPGKISDNLAALRVEHLLTMTTGHDKDTVDRLGRTGRMVQGFFALEVEHPPGAPFVYNSGATYILSAIVQKVTGEKLVDYLRPRLFEPLGATEAVWDSSDEGITLGGWGLSLSTESLAHFGQFLLQRGEWQGRQLVPAAWIDAATAGQVDNSNQDNPDWQQGYGYQFWRSRHNAYRGDGAFGQYCLILPEHDTAVILTSASPDMQATMDIIWQHLLPALQSTDAPGEAAPGAAVPGQAGLGAAVPGQAGLGADRTARDGGPGQRLGELRIPPPAGPAPAGGDGRRYRFARNHVGLTEVRLDEDGTGTFTFVRQTTLERSGGDPGPAQSGAQQVVFAPGDWQEHAYTLVDPAQRMVTSAYGDGDAFVATLRLLETPFALTFRCRPSGDRLVVDLTVNVAFGITNDTFESL
ncbi:serine hydrolase domain-containing protein [Kribbella flavida]|uniref:serine hydrolase domain-containing protein n=1 Tax=Kribbella flavida TaxID=182640 RepID=UPI001ED8E7EC|nr:serine hydrolase [Kribbella flavida]